MRYGDGLHFVHFIPSAANPDNQDASLSPIEASAPPAKL
jgi:hypothetical protein